ANRMPFRAEALAILFRLVSPIRLRTFNHRRSSSNRDSPFWQARLATGQMSRYSSIRSIYFLTSKNVFIAILRAQEFFGALTARCVTHHENHQWRGSGLANSSLCVTVTSQAIRCWGGCDSDIAPGHRTLNEGSRCSCETL